MVPRDDIIVLLFRIDVYLSFDLNLDIALNCPFLSSCQRVT